MANQVTKVRYVMCPKCRLVLKEPADIPVYQCGKCHTVLQAKNANVDRKRNTSVTVESISSQNNPLQHESEKVEQNSIDVSNSSCKQAPFSFSNGSAIIEMGRGTDKIAVLNEDPPREKFEDHNYHKMGVSSENVGNSNKEILLEIEQHGSDSLRSRHEAEKSTDRSIDQTVVLVEDTIRSSPTAKTSHDHYENISSHDDRYEDSVPNQYRLLSKRTFRSPRAFKSISSKEIKGGEVALVNGKIGMDSEAQVQERILSCNERYDSAIMGIFHLNRKEPTSKDGIHASQDSEDFHSVQNWMESELEKDVPSRFLSRDSHFHKDLPSNFHNGGPMSKFRYLEHNSKELLQKVDELRDQINKICGHRDEGNRIRPKNRSTRPGNSQSLFHTNESEQKTQFPSRTPPRPRKTEPSQPYQFSQLPVSGQANFSCLHCHQEDWKVSIKFPPSICCHKEKSQRKKKRHCRPVSRGAPFVICHKCLQLLHLPADFLISRRKYHKLRCGGCSDVLMFSLMGDGGHIIPHSYAEMQHPPSEVGSSSVAAVPKHEIPISHANTCLQGDPVSYSEDYDLSCGRSHSSEGEPVLDVNSPETEVERGDGEERKLASPLHRLMGYSSPSQIINQPGVEYEDEECQSTEVVKGRFHRTEENHWKHQHEGLRGVGTSSLYQEISSGGTSPYYAEMHKVDESVRRSRNTRGGSPLAPWT